MQVAFLRAPSNESQHPRPFRRAKYNPSRTSAAGIPRGVGRSGAILDFWNARLSNQSVVHSDPEIMGGTPVFVGTRVPVKSLYDYLEAGDSLDEFLESFPSVSREQAVAALELGREMTEARATSAR